MRRFGVGAAILLALLTACTSPSPEAARTPSSASIAPRPSPTSKAPTPVTAPPRFVGGVYEIGRHVRRHLLSKNWRPGCPVPIADLQLVKVSYWNSKGEVRVGPLVLKEQVSHDVLWVFRQLFRARFPIHRIDLAPRPQPIDWNSRRNLSSSFNCRAATGNPGSLSQHSYGWAIDINPLQNPYVRLDGSVLRAAAKPYRDRSRDRPGMIHPDDVVVRSFAKIGWEWGGNWHTLKDYMHFSLTGR
ncbi:MAG: M15 family metallopeptidase [Actinomycetota bacterium]|nr:M15 family metallopeptidase [Actinomycetota bacterium]